MLKEKIFQALKNKYANLGLSEETLRGLSDQLETSVTEEKDIDQAITGYETVLKSIQSESDRRASSANAELARVKAELEALKKTPKAEDLKPEPPKDMPDWAKALVDKIGTLENGLTQFNTERTSQSLTQTFQSMMEAKKVPPSFYKVSLLDKQFKDEADVNDYVTRIEQKYEDFKQEAANIGFSFTAPPESGSEPKSETEGIAALISQETKKITETKN